MDRVTAEMYAKNPERYTLVEGTTQGAPSCKYGNVLQWVGYDRVNNVFVRNTKSVYNRLISKVESNSNKQ
jgi:hypothetical protein